MPSPLARLIDHARPYHRRVRLATLCSILNKIFDIAPEMLIGVAVDVVVNKQASFLARLGIVDGTDQLAVLGGLTLVIWMAESAFEYAYQILWRNLAQTVQHDLRLDAYAHVQRLGMAWFEDRPSGGTLAILNDDVNQLERFLDGGANSLLQVAATVLLVGGIFFALSPIVATVAFVPIPVILWGAFRFQGRLQPRYRDVRDKAGLLAARLANNLGGMATIQGFTAEAREVEMIRQDSQAYLHANAKAIALSSAFTPVIRMAVLAGFVATMVLGGWLALHGKLAVGAYSVLIFLTQRLLWPLTRLAETVDQYQRAMASTARVLDLLDTPAPPQTGRALPATEVRGALRLEGVSLTYPNGYEALHDLTLDVPAGRTVALVGSTGSGKSSIVKLLLRFYAPTAGRVTLDGHDVADLDAGDLRRCFGLVSQDVFLFPGTVRDNLAYGKADATQAEIEAAARLAEAHAFILQLPQGYDTWIGERGQKLSGGQRQRLSIARAVLRDPKILVLDEATSAVDNETEAAIQRSLDTIAVGRTTVVIAHRLSTVRHADRIYVLEQGRLAEAGTHDELLTRGGLYAALWRVQTGERALSQAEAPWGKTGETGAEAPVS
jgi:ATP-binding cassette subfamily B protein